MCDLLHKIQIKSCAYSSTSFRTHTHTFFITSNSSSRDLCDFLPFTQPFLIGNLKAGLQLSSGTLSITKMEIADTFVCFRSRMALSVKEHSDSKSKYIEDDIIDMPEFLEDNIVVVFGWKVFQQIVSIPMGTSRHLSVLTQSGIHSLCSRLKRNSKHLSSTTHIDTSVMYFFFVNQESRFCEFCWSDVFRRAWEKRHD